MKKTADDNVKRRHECPDLGAASGRMMRALARRAGEGDMEGLEELHKLQATLNVQLATAVAGLRDAGYSWADIASCVGTSRQAAQQRWGA